MPALKNPRQEAFALEMANGRNQVEAAKLAGYTGKNIHVTACKLTKLSQVAARIQEIQLELKNAVLVDAKKLHARWSAMFEADINDILTEKGSFKPVKEWPKIWRQMLSACDVKELFEHSKDGCAAAWDKIGEVVRLKFVSVKDLGELIGRHKAVDAFVQQTQHTELHLHMHQEVEARLTQAREQAALMGIRIGDGTDPS